MRALLAIALVGCSGSDGIDLGGMYRVDTAVGSRPCGTDEPRSDAPAFLRFAKDEFLGREYFTYDGCDDADGTVCNTTGGLFTGFFEPIDDGWRGVVTSASGDAAACALTYFEQTAVLTGSLLVIESATHQETRAVSTCEPEEAERLGSELACEEHARVEATRL